MGRIPTMPETIYEEKGPLFWIESELKFFQPTRHNKFPNTTRAVCDVAILLAREYLPPNRGLGMCEDHTREMFLPFIFPRIIDRVRTDPSLKTFRKTLQEGYARDWYAQSTSVWRPQRQILGLPMFSEPKPPFFEEYLAKNPLEDIPSITRLEDSNSRVQRTLQDVCSDIVANLGIRKGYSEEGLYEKVLGIFQAEKNTFTSAFFCLFTPALFAAIMSVQAKEGMTLEIPDGVRISMAPMEEFSKLWDVKFQSKSAWIRLGLTLPSTDSDSYPFTGCPFAYGDLQSCLAIVKAVEDFLK